MGPGLVYFIDRSIDTQKYRADPAQLPIMRPGQQSKDDLNNNTHAFFPQLKNSFFKQQRSPKFCKKGSPKCVFCPDQRPGIGYYYPFRLLQRKDLLKNIYLDTFGLGCPAKLVSFRYNRNRNRKKFQNYPKQKDLFRFFGNIPKLEPFGSFG